MNPGCTHERLILHSLLVAECKNVRISQWVSMVTTEIWYWRDVCHKSNQNVSNKQYYSFLSIIDHCPWKLSEQYFTEFPSIPYSVVCRQSIVWYSISGICFRKSDKRAMITGNDTRHDGSLLYQDRSDNKPMKWSKVDAWSKWVIL